MNALAARGIPAGKEKQALYLTLRGARSAASRYRMDQATDMARAVQGVETGISRYAQKANRNPYHQLLVEAGDGQGLGDTGWLDVVNTFVGQIGGGLGRKLGGPETQVVNTPAPAPSSPSWVKPVVIGGGVLLVGGMIFAMTRKKGRR